jgi:NTE family protein
VEGRQQIFDSGAIIPAVLAACSIPAIFPPQLIDQVPYVDGGLSNNLPVEPFIGHKRDVVAVYVNPMGPYNAKSSIASLVDRAWHLSFREVIMRAAENCFLFIEPAPLSAIGLFDAHKLHEIYEHGYRYTRELLQEKKVQST